MTSESFLPLALPAMQVEGFNELLNDLHCDAIPLQTIVLRHSPKDGHGTASARHRHGVRKFACETCGASWDRRATLEVCHIHRLGSVI